jgi:hypothetical protein
MMVNTVCCPDTDFSTTTRLDRLRTIRLAYDTLLKHMPDGVFKSRIRRFLDRSQRTKISPVHEAPSDISQCCGVGGWINPGNPGLSLDVLDKQYIWMRILGRGMENKYMMALAIHELAHAAIDSADHGPPFMALEKEWRELGTRIGLPWMTIG